MYNVWYGDYIDVVFLRPKETSGAFVRIFPLRKGFPNAACVCLETKVRIGFFR